MRSSCQSTERGGEQGRVGRYLLLDSPTTTKGAFCGRSVFLVITATVADTRKVQMRDADLRSALHKKVLRDHHGQPDTLVIDELGLWYGTARVDIAVVNGRLHGYEIKSDRDTLDRLPGQREVYNNVLDRVTLVVGEIHLDKALKLIPRWWGVKVATAGPRKAVHFHEERPPLANPSLCPVAVAALLWCEELTEVLASMDAVRGLRGKSRDRLSRALAALLPLDELRALVRGRLKERANWRVAAGQT